MTDRSQPLPEERMIKIGRSSAGSDCGGCEVMNEKLSEIARTAEALREALGEKAIPFLTSLSICQQAGAEMHFLAYTDALRERYDLSAECLGGMAVIVSGIHTIECGHPEYGGGGELA